MVKQGWESDDLVLAELLFMSSFTTDENSWDVTVLCCLEESHLWPTLGPGALWKTMLSGLHQEPCLRPDGGFKY